VGITASINDLLYGIGISGVAILMTGASRNENASSVTAAEISAPKPPVMQSS